MTLEYRRSILPLHSLIVVRIFWIKLFNLPQGYLNHQAFKSTAKKLVLFLHKSNNEKCPKRCSLKEDCIIPICSRPEIPRVKVSIVKLAINMLPTTIQAIKSMFSTHSHYMYGSLICENKSIVKKVNTKETNLALATLVRMTASYFSSWKNVDKNPQLGFWCVENINSKMMVDSTRHHLINSNFIHHIIYCTSAIIVHRV